MGSSKAQSKTKKQNKQKKQRKWILWCISFILAFTFWLYASSVTDTTLEESFDLISIEYDSSHIKQHGLIVQSISIDTVNVTIMGSQRDLKSIGTGDILAKISLDKISEPGEYTLPVTITTPDRTTLIDQTVDSVSVIVDRPSEKDFPISSDSVVLTGWALDPGCYFGTHTVNATKVTVTGPTLELEAVESVKVRTSSSIGKASNGQTAAAEIVLLDKYGDEIKSKNLSAHANTDMLTVKLSVYMRKTVSLSAESKHGYFDESNISVSPSQVVITGTPDKVGVIDKILINEMIDETDPSQETSITTDKFIIPEGIEMTSVDGLPVKEAVISIDTDNIKEYTFTVSKDDIKVYSAEGMKALSDITVTVRLASSADLTKFASFNASCITATADASKANEDESVAVSLTISEDFRSFVYILDLDYSVKVGIPLVNSNKPSVDDAVNPL